MGPSQSLDELPLETAIAKGCEWVRSVHHVAQSVSLSLHASQLAEPLPQLWVDVRAGQVLAITHQCVTRPFACLCLLPLELGEHVGGETRLGLVVSEDVSTMRRSTPAPTTPTPFASISSQMPPVSFVP